MVLLVQRATYTSQASRQLLIVNPWDERKMNSWFVGSACAWIVLGFASQLDTATPTGTTSQLIDGGGVNVGPPRNAENSRDSCPLSQALELKLEIGNSMVLDLRPDAARCVFFDVRFPSRIELELHGPPILPSQEPQLRTLDTPGEVTIPTKLSVDPTKDGFVYRVTYALSSGSYMLQFGRNSKKPKRLASKSIYTLRVAEVTDITETLPLLGGSQVKASLDEISRSVTRRILVARPSLVSFSLLGQPWPLAPGDPLSINVRTADGSYIDPVESNAYGDGSYDASFVLSPGPYFVEIGTGPNYYPHPILKQRLRSAELVLRINELIDQNLPQSMNALQSWLTDVGLDKIMEVTEFADLRDPQRGLPRANHRLAYFAATVAFLRTGIPEWRIERNSVLQQQIARGGGPIAWPAGLKEVEEPRLVVSLRAKADRASFNGSEEAFEQRHQVGLWDRILQKISALEGISSRRIVIFVPVRCSSGLVFLHADHHAYREGDECASSSTSVPLVTSTNVGSAGIYSLKSLPRNLADTVPAFLTALMAPGRPELDFLTTEPDFIEVMVRGLRGNVIPGGRDWERIQLQIVITGGGKDRPLTLRVTVDGRIASGLGDFPRDSQFTRDMEPQYSMNLTEYAKKVANRLRDQLLRK